MGQGEQTNRAAAAAALTHGPHSQPPPTSLCSSEKKPLLFVSAVREGREVSGVKLRLASTTPPAIEREKKKKNNKEEKKEKEEKKQRPDFPPLPGVLFTHSVAASAHKHRLISGATTTLGIVFPAS